MSTLLERSRALSAKIARVRFSESSEQTIRQWEPLREGLSAHLDRLERLIRCLRLLRSQKLLPPGQAVAPKEANGLVTRLSDLRDRLLQKPEKVMQKNGWINADGQITGAAKALEHSLESAWKSYLAGLAPTLDGWEPFFQADRFGPQVRQIKTLSIELEGLARNLPESEEVLALAATRSAQIHDLVRKLDFGDIPAAVKKFIEQVNSPSLGGGATLADLDETALKWLREKALGQSFRVSMGGR